MLVQPLNTSFSIFLRLDGRKRVSREHTITESITFDSLDIIVHDVPFHLLAVSKRTFTNSCDGGVDDCYDSITRGMLVLESEVDIDSRVEVWQNFLFWIINTHRKLIIYNPTIVVPILAIIKSSESDGNIILVIANVE